MELLEKHLDQVQEKINQHANEIMEPTLYVFNNEEKVHHVSVQYLEDDKYNKTRIMAEERLKKM